MKTLKSPRGGKRPGAGKPKGVKWPSTVAKEQARELARQMITAALGPMIEAQIANAMGIKYLVVRQKSSGKFLRVAEAGAALKTDEEIIEVWYKDPSVQAFAELANRALDKAKEQEQEIRVSGDVDLIATLIAGRVAVSEKRRKLLGDGRD